MSIPSCNFEFRNVSKLRIEVHRLRHLGPRYSCKLGVGAEESRPIATSRKDNAWDLGRGSTATFAREFLAARGPGKSPTSAPHSILDPDLRVGKLHREDRGSQRSSQTGRVVPATTGTTNHNTNGEIGRAPSWRGALPFVTARTRRTRTGRSRHTMHKPRGGSQLPRVG